MLENGPVHDRGEHSSPGQMEIHREMQCVQEVDEEGTRMPAEMFHTCRRHPPNDQ